MTRDSERKDGTREKYIFLKNSNGLVENVFKKEYKGKIVIKINMSVGILSGGLRHKDNHNERKQEHIINRKE